VCVCCALFSFFFFLFSKAGMGMQAPISVHRGGGGGGGRASDMSSSLVRGMDMKGVVVYDDMRPSEYDLRRLEGLLL
jgi:hypothetical protein